MAQAAVRWLYPHLVNNPYLQASAHFKYRYDNGNSAAQVEGLRKLLEAIYERDYRKHLNRNIYKNSNSNLVGFNLV